jgi:hypothetical protein
MLSIFEERETTGKSRRRVAEAKNREKPGKVGIRLRSEKSAFPRRERSHTSTTMLDLV